MSSTYTYKFFDYDDLCPAGSGREKVGSSLNLNWLVSNGGTCSQSKYTIIAFKNKTNSLVINFLILLILVLSSAKLGTGALHGLKTI